MSFESSYRNFAVAAEQVPVLFPQLLAQFGEDAPDGQTTVKTIGAHWDDSAHTRKRAASFPTTITGQLLTDGRMNFRALWQTDLVAAWEEGALPQVEELTDEQVAALTPVEELP